MLSATQTNQNFNYDPSSPLSPALQEELERVFLTDQHQEQLEPIELPPPCPFDWHGFKPAKNQ